MNNSTTSKYYPAKELLEDLYINQRLSPDEIAKQFGVSGRTIRTRMKEYNIPRLGATHLRKGKVATWNVGIKRSEEWRKKNRQVNIGRTAYNKGQGDIVFVCEVCGKEVTDKPYRRKRTCSNECRYERMRRLRGEKAMHYKGGDTTSLRRARQYVGYKEWRKAVLDRDSYTCQVCSRQGERMTSHHLYTWNDHPDKALDIDNGICLCWDCHWSFHRDCSHYHTTPEMFYTWLTTKLTELHAST